MANYQIQGNNKLSGTVIVNSAKNSAVGILAASLLNKGVTTLNQVPRIEEVFRLIEILASLDVKVTWINDHQLKIIPPKKISLYKCF